MKQFNAAGLSATHVNLDEHDEPAMINWPRYDAVVVGSPVYVGHYLPEVIHWARANAANMYGLPMALFSVSLNAADKRPEARQADEVLLQQFIDKAAFSPDFVASFAGALNYTQYGWLRKLMMRKISQANGGPTDASRDYEMTNWDDVATFARAFSRQDVSSPFSMRKHFCVREKAAA